MNSLRLSPLVISFILRYFTGKTAAYKLYKICQILYKPKKHFAERGKG